MQGFSEWATRHCTIFGLFEARHREMIASWQAVFDACGFSAEELAEATGFLAANAPPEYPNQHLGAIQARVRSRRAVDLHRPSPDEDRAFCVHCSGGGLLSVPDSRGVVDGRWVGTLGGSLGVQFLTHAVTCACVRGRSMTCDNHRGDRLMHLADYELANPGWRLQLARRAREQLAEADAAPGGELPSALAAAMARLRGRQPGEDREEDVA